MLTFTLDQFQFALIHGPNIPGSYAILLFMASDLASITSHIHNWVLFLLWLHLFILSGVISPRIWRNWAYFVHIGDLPAWEVHLSVSYLFASSYCSWGLEAGILKWFAILFSSGPHFVRTLYHNPSMLGCPTGHGSQFQ